MAGTLTITDGTVSVNLYDASTLYLRRGGWRPGVAKENAAGDDYDDVTEVFSCEWMQTTDDARDTTMHNLNYLAAKARQNERQRKSTGQVYFSLNTPSESNVRYGVIKDINVPDLDSWHYGPGRPVKLTITARREGAWRKDSPLTAPQSYPSLAAATIFNKVDGAAVNYIDVAAANVTGDALALPVVHLAAVTTPVAPTIIVAVRSRLAAAEITNFNPHFNATNFIYAAEAAFVVADAGAPGGRKWSFSVGSSATRINYMPLPSGLNNYTGSFLLYAVVRATGNVRIRMGHGVQAAITNPTPSVSIPVTTNYTSVYLGRINIPASGLMPGMANPPDYYINPEISVVGAGTFEMRNFYLVPLDDGAFSIINPTNMFEPQLFADSILERCWYAQNYAGNAFTNHVPSPRGRYLRLKPKYNHRLLFYFESVDAVGGFNPNYSATATVRATMRYLALRGNT